MKITNKTKKIVAIIVVAMLAIGIILPLTQIFASADQKTDLNNKLKTNQTKKSNIKSEITDKKNKVNDVKAEKLALDKEVSSIEAKITEITNDIAKDDAKIQQISVELSEAEKKVSEYYQKYKTRMRVLYEQGSTGYLDALFESKSFTDFLNRLEIISEIATYDNNMVNELKAQKQAIADKKAEIEAVKQTKVAKNNSLKSEKNTLKSKQAERDNLILSLNKDLSALEKELKAVEAEENATMAAIAKLASTSANSTYTGGVMLWPAPASHTITSPYGYRNHPLFKTQKFHSGIDIGIPTGNNALAAADGKVITATYNYSYGNYVVIDHGGGLITLYAHGSALCCSAGQQVKKGTVIMKTGSTGYSTGPHLHFEVRKNGATVNPLSYVQ